MNYRLILCLSMLAWGCGTDSSGGVVPDATPPCVPFRSILTTDYLEGWDGVDVSDAVTCGTPPYHCTIFTGDGEGTVPFGVSQDPSDPSGCTFMGDVDSTNAPGGYGFIVEVHDDTGDTVDIPIYYQGESCDSADATLIPPSDPPQVVDAGSAYSWALTISDLDAVCDDTSCATCQWCAHLGFAALAPLTGADSLDCANTGDICSDCEVGTCIQVPSACPDVGVLYRVIEVREHDMIRRGPAWVTTEMELSYTGDDLPNCGSKQWVCHLETLER